MVIELLPHLTAWVHAAGPPQPPVAPPPQPGAPDFSHIAPNANGVPKSGVIFVIAQIILWVGLALLFVAGIAEVIKYAIGHQMGGMHISQQAKTNLARVLLCGLLLTAAGGIWTWWTAVS
jgi:hypothetical protein